MLGCQYVDPNALVIFKPSTRPVGVYLFGLVLVTTCPGVKLVNGFPDRFCYGELIS